MNQNAHNTAIDNDDLDDDLMALLDEEIVEENEVEASAESAPDENDLQSAVGDLEIEATRSEAYAEQQGESETAESDKPKSKDAKPAKAKKERKPREPRKTMATDKKSEVILDKLGENAGDYFVLEVSDADKSDEELRKQQEDLLATIDNDMAKKVSEKAVNLMSWLGSKSKLRTCTRITLDFMLANPEGVTKAQLRDHIQSGTSRPYGLGTARSQSDQMFRLLPIFKVGVTDDKVMKLNPESLIVARFKEDGEADEQQDTAEG